MKFKRWREKRKFKRVSILQDLYFGDQQMRPMESLSEEGMFIPTPDVFMKGSILDIKFKIFNDRNPISVQAEVRYVREGRGMGVRFLDIKPEDRKRIREFVKRVTK
jgi:c-di-GMP-binding flagellar brake protein YcgR